MNTTNSMDQLFLEKVFSSIEKNFSNPSFNVDHLAREIGISRYQLSRKLKVISGQSPSQMIREFRLQKAFDLLQLRALTISEIAYQVGFSSPSYFNTCFREHFGYPPGKVKRRTSAGTLKRYIQTPGTAYILLAVGFTVILMLVVFILSPWRDRATDKWGDSQTSIAVLPFDYLSDEINYQYLADAVMEEVIFHLSYNQELRVIPRPSVEQYRSTEKDIKQIARELNVEFILNGTFQKQGDQVNIIVYLVHARTNRIEWKHKFRGTWTDIFTIQNQIAQHIAGALDIEITPEVKKIIEKPPTASLDAADFYWRGNNELNKYKTKDNEALERTERLFNEAIRIDSTYARAYVGLARIYWEKHYWDTFLRDEFADSSLHLANKALSFDPQLADAYVLRGLYYHGINSRVQALEEFDRAISLNPSSAEAYKAKGQMYLHDDLLNRIENLHQAALLDRGEDLPDIYRMLGWGYAHAGFKEYACTNIENALELDGDSAEFYMAMSEVEHEFGDFKKSIDFGKKSYAIDSTHWWRSFLIGMNYSFLDKPEETLIWLKRYEEIQFNSGTAIDQGTFQGTFRLAHAYGINGFADEANHYIMEGLALHDKMLELNRHYRTDYITFYNMASLNAYLGNKEKAYDYLNQVNNQQIMPLWMIICLTNDPMFDSLREEPQFQQTVRVVETKYQAEHERLRQWLEKNDML